MTYFSTKFLENNMMILIYFFIKSTTKFFFLIFKDENFSLPVVLSVHLYTATVRIEFFIQLLISCKSADNTICEFFTIRSISGIQSVLYTSATISYRNIKLSKSK